jgi:hypothetical protein
MYNATLQAGNNIPRIVLTDKQLIARASLLKRKNKRTDLEKYKERIFTTWKHEIRNTIDSKSEKYKTKKARMLRESMLRLPIFKSHNFERCWWINTLSVRAYLTRIIKNNRKTFANRNTLSKEDKIYLDRLAAILELDKKK